MKKAVVVGSKFVKKSLTDEGEQGHTALLLQTRIEIPLLNTLVETL
jgi:hypothetical protein